MTLHVAVVCEASADRRTATDLADRVLCALVQWITDDMLDDYRLWRGLEETRPYLTWTEARNLARERRIRAHGHFGREPGAPDAHAARLALLLLHGCSRPPDAVLLIRDDDRQTERRKGLEQARVEAGNRSLRTGPIVVGLAHPCRECWVLHGFEPHEGDQREQQRFIQARQELGFDPCCEADRLTRQHQHEHRSAKRILAFLTDGDPERESDCWRTFPLAMLEARGQQTGLAAYLREVRERLAPLFGARSDT